ncbi:tripartite motif-containing protein 16 isoform X5 [Oncorhynchus tshawytscha]|uniref:tripartite motif-containing protein 16 isoform X5 n=1 Tax=Oncorhynchus tshawytscha TaxID=74940 RepID=UPI001C3D6DB8|nr:tripartite motif-containing protein 16 isoform X5 [Oncorhynchus tshawytscha]
MSLSGGREEKEGATDFKMSLSGERDTDSVDHGGECCSKSDLKKYASDLTLDPNTAFRELTLSEQNRKVTKTCLWKTD